MTYLEAWKRIFNEIPNRPNIENDWKCLDICGMVTLIEREIITKNYANKFFFPLMCELSKYGIKINAEILYNHILRLEQGGCEIQMTPYKGG